MCQTARQLTFCGSYPPKIAFAVTVTASHEITKSTQIFVTLLCCLCQSYDKKHFSESPIVFW